MFGWRHGARSWLVPVALAMRSSVAGSVMAGSSVTGLPTVCQKLPSKGQRSAEPAEYPFSQGLCLRDPTNRTLAALPGHRWHPMRLADCWQSRLVVLLAVDTQILSLAAQDPPSARRPVSVVGPDHGFHLIGRVVTFEMPLILGRRVVKQLWQRVFRRILRNLPLQTLGRDHATLKSRLVSVEHTRELDVHDEEHAG